MSFKNFFSSSEKCYLICFGQVLECACIPQKINYLFGQLCAFLQFLITSAKYSCVSDPEFGFILNNLRFENVGEGEVLNNRKISGTSADPETFAYDLKSAINAYEKRLTAVRVTMTYARSEKLIHITQNLEKCKRFLHFFTSFQNSEIWLVSGRLPNAPAALRSSM